MDKISITLSSSYKSPTKKHNGSVLSAIKKFKIGCFDLAFCFEKTSYEVQQTFNIENREFAPEITSG